MWRYQQRRWLYWRKPSEKALAAAEAAVATILTVPGVTSAERGNYTRLLPCPAKPKAPRIEHLLVVQKGAVVGTASKALRLPIQYVDDLVSFGAIHSALRCPKPPPNANSKVIALFRKASPKRWPLVKTMSLREAQQVSRVLDGNDILEPGSYLRVHVHPKRFPRCYEVDWPSRILANTKTYVVINKPAGVSVAGTVDNIEEACTRFAARALGLEAPLIATHQIDNCTEGCLVLAKNKEFSSLFHKLLKDRQVKKHYLVLATAPVREGRIFHFMRNDHYPPRIVSKDERVAWQLCGMEVLECKKVPWPSKAALCKSHVQTSGWEGAEHAYECRVNLLTGLTHQLRVQFAALGAPVLGDTMYTPAVLERMKTPEVDPFLVKDDSRSAEELKLAEKKWISMHGKEPELGIGLQSSNIMWNHDGETHEFSAGPPWWQAEADVKGETKHLEVDADESKHQAAVEDEVKYIQEVENED